MEFDGIELISKVGEGGMSTVFKGREKKTGRTVAVKILNRDLAENGPDVRAFRTEERLMEEIHHPGIVEAYGFSHAADFWYLLMEYVDGYTFASLLKRKQHVRESDCLLICESVAAALDYAWNNHGIVHCDIKPENIMINTDGVVKLLDLGISHKFQYLKDGRQEVPEHVTGTPAYISPEQVYGDVELDCRSDIYTLGATLYHLATGRILFPDVDNDTMMRSHCDESVQARDPRLYRPEITEGFARLLARMLVKNRAGRIQSWQEVFSLSQQAESGATLQPPNPEFPSSIKLS